MVRGWRKTRVLCVTAMVAVVACTAPTADPPPAAQESTSEPLDIGLTGRIHFNTQTADFARARTFYRRLGFTAGVGGFPVCRNTNHDVPLVIIGYFHVTGSLIFEGCNHYNMIARTPCYTRMIKFSDD